MKQDMKQNREDYLQAAESWGADRHAELTKSRRTAWIVASVAAAIAPWTVKDASRPVVKLGSPAGAHRAGHHGAKPGEVRHPARRRLAVA